MYIKIYIDMNEYINETSIFSLETLIRKKRQEKLKNFVGLLGGA